MILDALTGPVLGHDSLQVNRASFEALVILVSAHVLVEGLERNFAVPPGLLHNSDRQQCEREDNENFDPRLPSGQLFGFVMPRNDVFKDVDAVYLDFLILLLHLIFAEDPEVIIIDHEVLGYLSNYRYCAHVDGQPQETPLK